MDVVSSHTWSSDTFLSEALLCSSFPSPSVNVSVALPHPCNPSTPLHIPPFPAPCTSPRIMLAQTKTGKLPHNLHLENARVSYFLRALRRPELAGPRERRVAGKGEGIKGQGKGREELQ